MRLTLKTSIFILFLSILFQIHGYQYDYISSPDSIFKVLIQTEMGQRVEHECEKVEEFTNKIILHKSDGRVVLYKGNLNSVEIRRVPRTGSTLPNFTSGINLKAIDTDDIYNDKKSEIIGLLQRISFKALISKNTIELDYYLGMLENLITNRPDLKQIDRNPRKKRLLAKKIRQIKSIKKNKILKEDTTIAIKIDSLNSSYRYISVPIAHVRNESSFAGLIIEKLKFGEKIEVLNYNKKWYKIKIKSGKTGWIFNKLVVTSIDELKIQKSNLKTE